MIWFLRVAVTVCSMALLYSVAHLVADPRHWAHAVVGIGLAAVMLGWLRWSWRQVDDGGEGR